MKEYTPEKLEKKRRRIKNYVNNVNQSLDVLKGELSDLFYPQELKVLNLFLFEEKLTSDKIAAELDLGVNTVWWTLRFLEDLEILCSEELRENGKRRKLYKSLF